MPERLPPFAAGVAVLVRRLATLTADPRLSQAVADHAQTVSGAGEPVVDRAARLGRALGLTPFEYDLLLLAGLPEDHEAVAQLARQLSPRGEPYLTMPAIAAALDLDHVGRRHLRHALDGGALREHGLVTGAESIGLPERGVHLPSGLWSVLRGVDHWPAALRPLTLPVTVAPGETAARLAELVGDGRRLVVVSGGGTEVELAAQAAAARRRAGREVAAVPAAALDGDLASAWTPFLLARAAVPVVVGAPAAPPLPGHPATVVVAAGSTAGLPLDERAVIGLDVQRPDLGDVVAMWHRLLPELGDSVARLAGLVRVSELAATRAVADVRAASSLTGEPVSVTAVVDRVSRRTDASLPPSVRLTRPQAAWSELVVADDQRRLLASVAERMTGRAQVLHDWGFSRPARATGAVRVLLSGPPGTGKTLAVEVLAAELGLSLLTVDLSALVSKWLGETEKHISEVFTAAERCQAVLFFDEADAIFGRRTDSADAQARWANLETAHLLTQMESFHGLVVLGTNLRRNIDDAFLRRLDVVVELEEPDRAAREELWRRHLPPAAPLDGDVDVAALAAMYDVTGGLVRNAALSAAFAAAAAGTRIDQRTLITAVHDEYRKAGRSFPGAPRTAVHSRGGR